MRLLFACWLNPRTSDYRLFLGEAWASLGHDVRIEPYEPNFVQTEPLRLSGYLARRDPILRRRLFGRHIRRACSEFRPDVVLLAHPWLERRDFDVLRRELDCAIGQEIPQATDLKHTPEELIAQYDFLIVHDTKLQEELSGSSRGQNENVFWMGSMAEPSEHRPLILTDEDRRRYGGEVAFIGSYSPNRAELLGRLVDRDLRIWGDRRFAEDPQLAPFFRDEPVYGLKKTKIYNAAAILLNIEDSRKHVHAISQRIPEALASGGFVLTDWHEDLEQTPLVEGQSLACYRSAEEMVEQIGYYVARPEQRRAITDRGRRLVLEQMTYQHTAARLASLIEDLLSARKGRA